MAVAVGTFAINLFFSRYVFGDTYLDLAAGRYIADHGIPRTEVFTVEGVARPWIDQQWLAHLVYYQAWVLGGYALLALLSSALVAAGIAGLFALMLRRDVPAQRALLWSGFAFVACMGNTIIRAQSFAYPLLVFVFWTFLADFQRRRFSWFIALLLPVLVLWSNLHGTVALAIVLVVAYCSWRALRSLWGHARADARRYALVALCAPLTLFANPYGLSIVHYYWALIGNPVVKEYVIEWQPPSPWSQFSLGFFALAVATLASVGYALLRRRKPDIVLVALAATMFAVAMQGVRYQAWFAMAGALLGAEALASVRPTPPTLSPRFLRLGAFGITALLAVSLVQLFTTSNARFETQAPRGAIKAAAAYLAKHPESRVLADDDSSTALLWKEPSSIGRVAFDARFEQFPQVRLRKWFDFFTVGSSDWSTITAGYDAILATRETHPELLERLKTLLGWRAIYADRGGAVYVRASGAGR